MQLNEDLEETKAYRAGQTEMRRLQDLRTKNAADLAAAQAETTQQGELEMGRALLAQALAGEKTGTQHVITSAERIEQLQALDQALFGAIETQGFKLERLLDAAIRAGVPAARAAIQARAKTLHDARMAELERVERGPAVTPEGLEKRDGGRWR